MQGVMKMGRAGCPDEEGDKVGRSYFSGQRRKQEEEMLEIV